MRRYRKAVLFLVTVEADDEEGANEKLGEPKTWWDWSLEAGDTDSWEVENEVRPASLETLLELQGNADTQEEHDALELQIIAVRREANYEDEVRPDGPETDRGGLIGQQPY